MTKAVGWFVVCLVLGSVWVFYAACVALYGLVMFGWGGYTGEWVLGRLRAFWSPLRGRQYRRYHG